MFVIIVYSYSEYCILCFAGWNWEVDSRLSRVCSLPTITEGMKFLQVVFRRFRCILWSLFCTFSPQDELEEEVESSKTVNLELVFGYHWKPGTGKSVSLQLNTSTLLASDGACCWLSEGQLKDQGQSQINLSKLSTSLQLYRVIIGYSRQGESCFCYEWMSLLVLKPLFWGVMMMAVMLTTEGITTHI